jgi:hypothetical protein
MAFFLSFFFVQNKPHGHAVGCNNYTRTFQDELRKLLTILILKKSHGHTKAVIIASMNKFREHAMKYTTREL